MAPMLLYYLNSSAYRGPWRELPSLLQPVIMARWWLVVVYAALAVLTRRKIFALPIAAACAFAAGRRRDLVLDFASDHRDWCLVVTAFLLLFVGGCVTACKHRRRLSLEASAARISSFTCT